VSGGLARDVAFWPLALGAVALGFAVFRLNSMARATMALLGSFLCAAGVVLLLELTYLGLLVVLMMVIEMVVMAVFMVAYMMNPGGLMPMEMVHNRRGALAIATAVFAALAAGIFLVPWHSAGGPAPDDPTLDLGQALMGSKMLVMMVLGLALFATIVGVVVLAVGRGRYDRMGDDLRRRPPDDPIRGGLPR
jgi:NADH:ubiquinone oxidoreductase subunit 6 (subunit J)